jgi:hypothetical protein
MLTFKVEKMYANIKSIKLYRKNEHVKYNSKYKKSVYCYKVQQRDREGDTETERERERVEDEWSREGGVRDRSFRLHSFMGGEAPSSTWVYCQRYSS